jgi:predicted RNA-binding protein with TRAM domain
MVYGNFNQRQSFAPVKVGDELEVKIESVGEKGDGVCKKNGFVLFVPGAKEGQDVKIKVTKVLRRVGFAEIVGEASGEKPTKGKKSKQEAYDKEQDEEEFEGKNEEEFDETENEEEEDADEDFEEALPAEEETEYKDSQEFEDSEDFGEEQD